MKRSLPLGFSVLTLGGALLLGLCALPLPTARAATESQPADGLVYEGECTFGGRKGPVTATLKKTGENTYDVSYVATWSGKPTAWTGTIKSDLKGEISGTGSARNGSFEFSGKFTDGVAKCSYKEVGGRRGRSGTLTLAPQKKAT